MSGTSSHPLPQETERGTPLVDHRDLVVGISPFGGPGSSVVAAVCRAGSLGVLDLGPGGRRARVALGEVAA